MTVTKITLPQASIHQIVGGQAFPSGVFPGDIIDAQGSLGHPGSSMLIEAYLGSASVSFDVTQKFFGRHDPDGRWGPPYVTYANAEFYTRPVPSGEVEVQRDVITVDSGVVLAVEDMSFIDFKVVTIDSGVRIIFH